jgi:hypothetical protein
VAEEPQKYPGLISKKGIPADAFFGGGGIFEISKQTLTTITSLHFSA